ncbi:thiamine-phosphate kinase [Dactylosporangium matsuzakiense]|uniref:Thiamine-monophosphate kinase n=1 Tax=Dactylosporangium matsuzakiense TaxID=53360 RepID=A0A9W6KKK9_9ACTN|nr:thiamine-phosphate kinase [Dactylosporangium matsuzakiense]GLL02001.1 thiamine-monophosphate kinase [Dactylosporangium matsuzakiense]
MTVATAGEFGLISRVTARLGAASPLVLLGPGDDGAIVATPDARVVASTDVLVDGRHFRRDWSSARDVGHRAAAANLADIAAMGARPTALLVALCAPPDLQISWAEELADGLAAEAVKTGATVVGGDTSSSPTLTIAVTALGDLAGQEPLVRSGARPGDVVAVAGRIGHAAAGYTILSRGFRSPKVLVDAFRRPDVPYHLGPVAARMGATSMIDVSDGLLADLGHIAVASGVGIDLRRDAFQVPEAMRAAATALGVDPYGWILAGGDDHALAATFPPDVELGDDWLVVGSVLAADVFTAGEGVTVDGRRYAGGAPGWDHFR